MNTAGVVYTLIAALLWALIGPLSKNCIALGMDSLQIALWRVAGGALCFGLHGLCVGNLRVAPRHALIFLLFGAWACGGLFVLLQVAIARSGAALAVVLLYTAPAWVAVMARIWFNEALTRQKLLALGVASVGTALVCLGGGSLPDSYDPWGVAMGLASGFAYATFFPFYTYWQRWYKTSTIYIWLLMGGFLCIGACTLAFSTPVVECSLPAVGNLLALGVLTIYGAYLLFSWGLQRITQVQSAIIGFVEPIAGTLMVWAWYGENFDAAGWLGCLLVLGSVGLLAVSRKK